MWKFEPYKGGWAKIPPAQSLGMAIVNVPISNFSLHWQTDEQNQLLNPFVHVRMYGVTTETSHERFKSA